MNNLCKIFCTITLLLVPVIGWAGIDQNVLKQRMIEDLGVIKNTFSVRYAPAEWKKIYADWDLNEQIELAKTKVLSTKSITTKDYQKILKEFFKSTRDYHVGAMFYSTANAYLPFRVQKAEDRYFITWVDQTEFPDLAIGDEIILFDDQRISDAIEEIKKCDLGNNESLTDQGFAEEILTYRMGSLGHEVPSGPVNILVKHTKSEIVKLHQLEWFSIPEEIQEGHTIKSGMRALAWSPAKPVGKKNKNVNPFFKKEMTAYMYEAMHASYLKRKVCLKCDDSEDDSDEEDGSDDNEDDDGFEMLGSKKGPLPHLGEVLYDFSDASKDISFRAYVYSTPEGKIIGYIRIPHYMPGPLDIMQFGLIIQAFEGTTDALVIDQLDNPGGIVVYMYALASMLTSDTLEIPMQRMTITQEDVFFALQALKTPKLTQEEKDLMSFGYTQDELQTALNKYSQYIIDEWNAGRTFTDPTHMLGVDKVKSHPMGCYTNPILVLVNHMAISCGDFFPAILQDNKRATIFGTRTAGAGGFVLSHSYPNQFGLAKYRFTGSIAQRVDNNPIENLGVCPDIFYEITAKDLSTGKYEDYVEAVNKALKKLIEENVPAG